MTQHLPPSLLSLFAPRPPIPYLPPLETGGLPPYSGIAQFVSQFEDTAPPASGRDPFETKTSRKKRLTEEKIAAHNQDITEKSKSYNPTADTKATGDPYRTLFVAKVNYNTTDHKLKREFEMYGPIKKIRSVVDEKGKPRGYAFIEYEKERDMKSAAAQADGKKIDGRRVLVDHERGRTQREWRPRKYGGGLGYSRATSEERYRLVREERERDRERESSRSKEGRPRDARESRDGRDGRDGRDYGDSRGRSSLGGGDRDRERERTDRERGERERYNDRDEGRRAEKRPREESKGDERRDDRRHRDPREMGRDPRDIQRDERR